MAKSEARPRQDPDEVRMTLGEHLDELRGALVRSLVALLVACLLCIWPAKFLLELISRPMVLALRHHGQPETFLQTGPAEALLVYAKVVIIFGLLFAAPYILYQVWSFVAAGLYPHERRWVYKLFPASIGLFAAGVAFMYFFVLLLSLNFLIGFSGWLPLPSANPTAFEAAVLGMSRPEAASTQPHGEGPAAVPLLVRDPVDPPVGAVWVNQAEHRLKVHQPDGVYSTPLTRDDRRALVTTHFRIGEYLTFVLVLMIAFGAAFQMPLVVLFLARTGIVPVAAFRAYRKFVILLVVVIAGILAPADLLSHLLLAAAMILLFELGLWLASRSPTPLRARATGAVPERSRPSGVQPRDPEGS
ncbi:MAG: twin-arginine translocase subunit TatC [Phycisphaerales bacterium]|nr:twin-arginine translocase subunit TatC [Phycisphaerales bacterium]